MNVASIIEIEQKVISIERQLIDSKAAVIAAALRNDETHDRLEVKLDATMAFQNKLRWIAGTTALIAGSVIGYIIHHAAVIWEFLPMHGHTH